MQRCPKCGYREGADWPRFLWIVAFGFLYLVFIFTADQVPKIYRWMGLAAYVLFSVGSEWKRSRERRVDREYARLHPPVTDRVKDHLKANPANSH